MRYRLLRRFIVKVDNVSIFCETINGETDIYIEDTEDGDTVLVNQSEMQRLLPCFIYFADHGKLPDAAEVKGD